MASSLLTTGRDWERLTWVRRGDLVHSSSTKGLGGGDVACNGLQVLSLLTLGPCGHSRGRGRAAIYSGGCGGEKRDDAVFELGLPDWVVGIRLRRHRKKCVSGW